MDLKEQIAQRRNAAGGGGILDKENLVEPSTQGVAASKNIPLVDHRRSPPGPDPDALILNVDQITTTMQARKTFRNLDQLADSIREQGQVHPIVVEPLEDGRYQLIAGERRLRAIRDLLGWKEIRASLKSTAVDQTSRRILQLTENNQRENYDPFELAEELASLQQITGWKDAELARRLHVTRSWVSKKLSLRTAPTEVQEAIRRGEMGATTWFNEKKTILTKGQRVTFIKIPYDATLDLIELLQRLAARYTTNPIELSAKPTKKEIVAILTTRPVEIKGCLE